MRVAHLVSYWFVCFLTIHTILFAALLTTQQLNVRNITMRSMRKRTEETNTEREKVTHSILFSLVTHKDKQNYYWRTYWSVKTTLKRPLFAMISIIPQT